MRFITILIIALVTCAVTQNQGIDLNRAIVVFRQNSDDMNAQFLDAMKLIEWLAAENKKLRAENDSLRATLAPKKEKGK